MRLSLKSIAIGVLGDVSTPTICVLKGSVIDGIEIVYKKCNLSSEYSPSEFNVCLNITRKTAILFLIKLVLAALQDY